MSCNCDKIVPILDPFADVTEILGKEHISTASYVCMLLHKLVSEHLKPIEDDGTAVSEVKKSISQGLKKRFGLNGDSIPKDDVLFSSCLTATVVLVPVTQGTSPQNVCLLRHRIVSTSI